MKLLIVIPALNEEDSIEETIKRCLAAQADILSNTLVTAVNITVVSDGSTDNTEALARQYTDQIKLIVFHENRGYGAAIKEAWQQSDADLLSFLDADGTCDPLFFPTLVNALAEDKADVALGCRMTPNSEMPMTRRIGNAGFSILLSMISSQHIRDTASGMRVVRKTSLYRLLPLPDGLEFTPAMSARAILSDDLKIVERDMLYSERKGESKLNPFKDGIRFLLVIIKASLTYRPSRLLGIFALTLIFLSVLMMITPTAHYFKYKSVQEWMIYRFIVSSLLGNMAVLLLCAGYVGSMLSDIALNNNPSSIFLRKFFQGSLPFITALLLFFLGVLLVYESMVTYWATGHVFEHWSRFIVSSFFVIIAVILLVTKLLNYILDLVVVRKKYLQD